MRRSFKKLRTFKNEWQKRQTRSNKKKDRLTGIDGLPPSLLNIKPGCAFCLRIGKETLKEPKWIEKDKGHFFSECKSCLDYKV